MTELGDTLNQINRLSGQECISYSGRKRLLQQIELLANEAIGGLTLSRDEEETIIGLRNGTCRVVL